MQLDTRRFRPHQVLGDAQQYQAIFEQQERLQAQQSEDSKTRVSNRSSDESLADIDPASVPKDVWAAAQLLGDRGVRLVRIYRELADQREATIQQITVNQTRHAQEQQQLIYAGSAVNQYLNSSRKQQQQHQQQSSRHDQSSHSPTAAAPADACMNAHASPAGLGGSGLASSSSGLTNWREALALYSSATVSAGRSAAAAPGQLLSKRTVMDSIVESHDERVLARWAAQQSSWQAQAAALVAATGKDPRDLTLARGDEWRRKLELLAALEVAVPAAAAARHKVNKTHVINSEGGYNNIKPNADGSSSTKGSINDGDAAGTTAAAGGHWMSTLRNANERFVVVNNIFSGLFLPLHNRTTVAVAGMTTIRKPTVFTTNTTARATAVTGTTGAGSATVQGSTFSSTIVKGSTLGCTSSSSSSSSSTARRRGWMDDRYLKKKMALGAAAVAALSPAAPDPECLAMCGTSLDCTELAASLAVRPVGLHDVEKRLAVADPALFQEYQAAQQVEATRAAAAAAAEADQARRAAARAAAAAYPHPGPHLEADTDWLSLHYTVPAGVGSGSSGSGATAQPILVNKHGQVLTASGGTSCTAGADGSTGCTASAATAVLTVSNTGTAAVYYNWTCTGRRRALQAAGNTAAAPDDADHTQQEGEGWGEQQQQQHAIGQWMPDAQEQCAFYLPKQQGVILPWEQAQFRFSFKSTRPGIFHETWAMTTHPPLQPNPNAAVGSEARKKGHPIRVALKGVAVTESAAGAEGDGRSSSGMGLVQRQQQLESRLAAQCKETQVQSALASLLDKVMQQVAQKQAAVARQRNSKSINKSSSTDATSAEAVAAAKWAAANPPVFSGSSSSSSDTSSVAALDGAGVGSGCKAVQQHYYYYPEIEAQLNEVYSKAVLLLQPPPPPEAKKGGKASMIGSIHISTATSNNSNISSSTPANSADSGGELPPLPETWDCSVSGLRAALARLSGLTAHKQSGAVLSQRAEVALRAAAVPRDRQDMVEAACRQVLLQLAATIPAAADAARAAAVAQQPSDTGSVASAQSTHRGRGVTGMALTDENTTSSSSSGAAMADNVSIAANNTAAPGTSSTGHAATPTATAMSHPPSGHGSSSGGGGGGGGTAGGAATHRTKAAAAAAAAAGPPINQEQYHKLLSDSMWTAARQQFGGFEQVLGQFQAAAAAKLDAAAVQAAAAAAADVGGLCSADAKQAARAQEKREDIAWAQFAPMRRKQALGLV